MVNICFDNNCFDTNVYTKYYYNYLKDFYYNLYPYIKDYNNNLNYIYSKSLSVYYDMNNEIQYYHIVSICLINIILMYYIVYYIEKKFGIEYTVFTYYIKTKKNPNRKTNNIYKNNDNNLIKNIISFSNFDEFYNEQYPKVKKFYKTFNDVQIYDHIRNLYDSNFAIISL